MIYLDIPDSSPPLEIIIDSSEESDCIDCMTASITIRKLPEPTKEKLRIRAARAGLSLEAYSRRVLQAASETDFSAPPNIADLALSCFGDENGIDLDLPARGHGRKPLAFD